MHTRAAELQSLSNHSLAHVKQYFLPARFSLSASTVATAWIFAILLPGSACITQPRQESAASTTSFEAALIESKSEHNSRINLNSADAKELEALPGIGEAIAGRILEHRGKYGRFRRAEHLMMVRGISDRKFRELRGLITTE